MAHNSARNRGWMSFWFNATGFSCCKRNSLDTGSESEDLSADEMAPIYLSMFRTWFCIAYVFSLFLNLRIIWIDYLFWELWSLHDQKESRDKWMQESGNVAQLTALFLFSELDTQNCLGSTAHWRRQKVIQLVTFFAICSAYQTPPCRMCCFPWRLFRGFEALSFFGAVVVWTINSCLVFSSLHLPHLYSPSTSLLSWLFMGSKLFVFHFRSASQLTLNATQLSSSTFQLNCLAHLSSSSIVI